MNLYIQMQIKNMISSLDLFLNGCRMASTKDDGIIDREEARLLKKIENATDIYRRELEKLTK